MKTIDHIRDGVVARYTETNGLKLAVCVGFGRDYRPRVRFYRATAGTTPKLGFGPAHVALLVAGNGEQQTSVLAPIARSERGGGTVVGGTDPCVCSHAPEEHGHDPDHPSSTHCTECDCIAYESDPGEA